MKKTALFTCLMQLLCIINLSAEDTLWRHVAISGIQERTTPNEQWEIQRGSFVIRSSMPEESQLTCYFSFPQAKGKRESPHKQDVVYFFHTPNPQQGKVLENGICNKLVRDYGMSVFCIAFTTSSNHALFHGPPDKQKKYYAFSASGSFKSILTAWTVIREHLQIEKPDFFLYGYSAGGIGVQRFAEEYPEYTAGIVSVNGHSFVKKNGAACPHLIIHSFGDGGVSAGDGLYRNCLYRNVPCGRILLSPQWSGLIGGNDGAFHAVNGGVVDLATSYLFALAKLRQNNPLHKVPSAEKWPYWSIAQDPLVLMKPSKIQSNQTSPSIFPIPSAEFYSYLVERPLPPREITLSKSKVIEVRPRPDTEPVAQLIECIGNEDGASGLTEVMESRPLLLNQYIAEHGVASYLVLACLPPKELVNFMPRAASLHAIRLTDPLPNEINIPEYFSHVVIHFTNPTTLVSYLNELQLLLLRGQRVLVLLPYLTEAEYGNATISINPLVREKIFPSFSGIGKDAALSLEIQQIKMICQFLTEK